MFSMVKGQESHLDSAKKHPTQPHLVFGLSNVR